MKNSETVIDIAAQRRAAVFAVYADWIEAAADSARPRHARPSVILVTHRFPLFALSFFHGLIARPHVAAIGGQRDETTAAVVVNCDRSLSSSDTGFEIANTIIDAIGGGLQVLLLSSSRSSLPSAVDELIDDACELPKIDGVRFRDACLRLFSVDVGDAIGVLGVDPPWLAYVSPADFLLGRVSPGTDIVKTIADAVQQRLASVQPAVGPTLADIAGMEEAKAWAHQLLEDLRLVSSGVIGWESVDRGALLQGPPGVGKTAFARAIAGACGLHFVATSAAGWERAGSLDQALRAIQNDFDAAREFAPSLIFIDEIDSMGNRENLNSAYREWQTSFINFLLEQLDGFVRRDRIVVIAATNDAERVDPALRRAGRLDRTIDIPFPNSKALSAIFQHYLRDDAHDLSDDDFVQLGRMSLGLTGADVELFVRGARRRARRDGLRKIGVNDLTQEIFRTPTPEARRPASEGEIRRTAVHESGHALLQLLSPDGGAGITFVSIIPRSDGSAGFVARVADEKRLTRTESELRSDLRCMLAGRAAEELVYGKGGISTGAGGPPSSDLACASRAAYQLAAAYGFSESLGLRWRVDRVSTDSGIADAVDRILVEEYAEALRILAVNRSLLDRLATVLFDKQEVTLADLRRLLPAA